MGAEENDIVLKEKTEKLWEDLASRQGETFYTAKKLPFQYTIRGGEMFVDRRSRSITRATFAKALRKIEECPGQIKGPKSLNVFGAPYVWALLLALGAVKVPREKETERKTGGTPSV